MKFSISQILYAMIGFALIAAIVGAGVNGSPLAYGMGVSICLAVVYFICFALLHGFALLIAGSQKSATPDVVAEIIAEPATEPEA